VLEYAQLHAALIALLLQGSPGGTLIGQDSVLVVPIQVLLEVLAPHCTGDGLAVTDHSCGTLGVGLLLCYAIDLADQIPEGFLYILGGHGTRLDVCDLYTMINDVKVTVLLAEMEGLVMFDLPPLYQIAFIPDEY
jgi:hypothetical protein